MGQANADASKEASVANMIVAIFAHHDDRTAPPFEVLTPHETGQCLA